MKPTNKDNFYNGAIQLHENWFKSFQLSHYAMSEIFETSH
jgi:hypothetical protein